MKIPKFLRCLCALFMAALMSNIPAVAGADQQMIPTIQVMNELNRAQSEKKVEAFLRRADVQGELVKQGLSAQEASQRLASLSDFELAQLTRQMEEARYGGDILVTILVVVLIIFLIKRI